MKRLTILLVVVAALAAAGPAGAKLYHVNYLDPVATNVAGFPLTVNSSDLWDEWNLLTGDDPNSLFYTAGFTYPTALPTSTIFDPYDGYRYYIYRVVWINPDDWATFRLINGGLLDSIPAKDAASALMLLDHEAMHQKLQSFDEGRVEACALADIPRLLRDYYHLAETTTEQYQVPVRKRVRVRVRIHGKLVWRYRYVRRYVWKTRTIPNPVFVNIVAAAVKERASSPPPYNSGVCA